MEHSYSDTFKFKVDSENEIVSEKSVTASMSSMMSS